MTTAVPVGSLLDAGVAVAGVAIVAFLAAAVLAAIYRWYARGPVPRGIPTLVSLSLVAGYLNARTALGAVVQGQTDVLAPTVAAFNLVALAASGLAATVGRRSGDHLAASVFDVRSVGSVDGDLSRIVRAVGRVTTVTLPETVEDIDGYDPVSAETREALAGRTLTFPRGLTVAEVRDRLIGRLKEEFEVGYVDVELDDSGTVAYLAVGARVAGIGPTLPPGTAAVAVRADPPNAASPGDVVQLWIGGDAPQRVTLAEIRAIAGDVVTLALDESDAPAVAGGEYRLVTLPSEVEPEREFAGLLRAAAETMDTVTAGESLAGLPVGALDLSVAAVRSTDGPVEAIPKRSREIRAGDTLFVVGRPDAIRRLHAEAADGSGVVQSA